MPQFKQHVAIILGTIKPLRNIKKDGDKYLTLHFSFHVDEE